MVESSSVFRPGMETMGKGNDFKENKEISPGTMK